MDIYVPRWLLIALGVVAVAGVAVGVTLLVKSNDGDGGSAATGATGADGQAVSMGTVEQRFAADISRKFDRTDPNHVTTTIKDVTCDSRSEGSALCTLHIHTQSRDVASVNDDYYGSWTVKYRPDTGEVLAYSPKK